MTGEDRDPVQLELVILEDDLTFDEWFRQLPPKPGDRPRCEQDVEPMEKAA